MEVINDNRASLSNWRDMTKEQLAENFNLLWGDAAYNGRQAVLELGTRAKEIGLTLPDYALKFEET